jgi:hypothetical protein
MSTHERATAQEELRGTYAHSQLDDLRHRLFHHLMRGEPHAIEVAAPALNAMPHDPEVLLMAVIAALLDARPKAALRYLHRFNKRFVPYMHEDELLKAVALAQQESWRLAWNIVHRHGRTRLSYAVRSLPIGSGLYSWFGDWLARIENEERRRPLAEKRTEKAGAAGRTAAAKTGIAPVPDRRASGAALRADTAAPPEEDLPALPRHTMTIPLAIELPASLETDLASAAGTPPEDADAVELFRLRYEFTELGLLQGFDELLCLPALHGVE